MRATKGGEEVVERTLVGQVGRVHAQVRLHAVSMPELLQHIVPAEGGVEHAAWCDARGIFVGIEGTRRGNSKQLCALLCAAATADGVGNGGDLSTAIELNL